MNLKIYILFSDEKGKNIGPVHIGKSVLFFDSVTEEDIDTYKCVVESCCGGDSEDINVDVKVPDATCEGEMDEIFLPL